MRLGFRFPFRSQSNCQRVGALSLFTLAGLLAGIGEQTASAQTVAVNASGIGSTGAGENRPSGQNAVSGTPLMVKLDTGHPVEFLVENPSWRESKAVRVVDSRRPHTNINVTIFARLVVGVENERVLKDAIATVTSALGSNRPGSHTFRPFLERPDVFVVEANSVEDAITLANELTQLDGVLWAEVDSKGEVENESITTDPLAPFQWHVLNPGGLPFNNDHKIDRVYDTGITGSGVVVGILEAFDNSFYHVDEFGVLFINPDLANQLNEELSIPTAPFNVSYSHGVSVAGLVAAEGNNGISGSGVAYGAQLASLNNSSNIAGGESFAHELRDIDIVNNSWGPVPGPNPVLPTGKYLATFPDDFEIDIPEVRHNGLSRMHAIGLDQGIRLGRDRKGRIFVFSAGNGNHFQGFPRLALGNAISLPGVGIDPIVPEFGYLDITGLDPTDGNGDGVPDVFLLDGRTAGLPPSGDPAALQWRWSGHLGNRVDYRQAASMTRTFAIASVAGNNNLSGYSNTGSSVFAGAYVQDAPLGNEFVPQDNSWSSAPIASDAGVGVVTITQGTSLPVALVCDAIFGTSAFIGDESTCFFNGTSAAAPIASGIIALMLEANPNLTIRDIQHIIQQTSTVVNYDPTNSYWPSVILGLGATDPDDGTPPTPTFWSTNAGGVRHSDEYGFGVIDAEAAVAAAATYGGSGQLFILDSGLVEEGDDGAFDDGDITDATFTQAAIISENLETNILLPGARHFIPLNCVRQNFTIEGVEITLNIQGDGAGDLLIALMSPRGTISPLALPRGDSNGLNGGAYTNFTFSTYKYWGELSGGQWTLIIQDFRPDEESPEGSLPTDPMPPNPAPSDFGLEQVTYLGAFGLPGNPDHTEKTLLSYRLQIFSTDDGVPAFEGCPPQSTSCPGDLDGNGFIDIVDLQIYINWFLESNPLADLDGDGDIDFDDIGIYRTMWTPGFCDRLDTPFSNGRPNPGGSGIGGGNGGVVRPI